MLAFTFLHRVNPFRIIKTSFYFGKLLKVTRKVFFVEPEALFRSTPSRAETFLSPHRNLQGTGRSEKPHRRTDRPELPPNQRSEPQSLKLKENRTIFDRDDDFELSRTWKSLISRLDSEKDFGVNLTCHIWPGIERTGIGGPFTGGPSTPAGPGSRDFRVRKGGGNYLSTGSVGPSRASTSLCRTPLKILPAVEIKRRELDYRDAVITRKPCTWLWSASKTAEKHDKTGEMKNRWSNKCPLIKVIVHCVESYETTAFRRFPAGRATTQQGF